ncbi:hypothetical protein FRACYDRAFT_235306 [Fragilariopsis cylindrus CCMP1102]|uniref:C2H2-type domain-containing protein n=1 Tax=Fragilariopsis cylindrus CCMP1102 TaxID=635003 RepID=A0A1E7FM90_9STRA|nr:hypothetical protein FRACYDRAFT_235306 [Fragilariopsis cylindrus CCMP1102]|eukprot:OEU19256.1 hypothetical protein FRACYDRAFT_235306 [Fragilariopsis cylindrus CCMP1102]
MPTVKREDVIEAVREYGLAWTTQDSKRIGRLFTQNAVYVERSFDKKATFRGRDAIQKYWTYQICGKQSNISFRHVASEMVRDADNPIAVVKWMAEFDNRRENRADKTNKRVKFCQMAKLIFEVEEGKEKTMKISYLEEYAQGMLGKNCQWPGIDASVSDNYLWERIRFDPPKPPPAVACEICGESFPSRTKLFAHIRNTGKCYEAESGRYICVPNSEATKKKHLETVLVCFSLSYTCRDPERRLICAWEDISSVATAMDSTDDTNVTQSIDDSRALLTLTWAVPLSLSSAAIINVVTMKLPRILVEQIKIESLPDALNKVLTGCNVNTKTPPEESSLACLSLDDANVETERDMIIVHTAGLVQRPCAPERREFETYAAFIPWAMLKSQTNAHSVPVEEAGKSEDDELEQDEAIPPKLWRIPIEETSAFKFVDADASRRVKRAARLMKNGDQEIYASSQEGPSLINAVPTLKLKVCTCTMEEPMHHCCKISISVRQPLPGYVERLLALLVAYARSEIREDEFIAATKNRSMIEVVQKSSNVCPFHIAPFPTAVVLLLEPALTRFENKTKLKLCQNGNTYTEMSTSMKRSIDKAQDMIMDNFHGREHLMKRWLSSRQLIPRHS